MRSSSVVAKAAVCAMLAAVGCTDATPTTVLDVGESRILPDRRAEPQPLKRKILSRMRIKLRKGATAEIVLQRENGRIVAMSARDRDGAWHEVLMVFSRMRSQF